MCGSGRAAGIRSSPTPFVSHRLESFVLSALREDILFVNRKRLSYTTFILCILYITAVLETLCLFYFLCILTILSHWFASSRLKVPKFLCIKASGTIFALFYSSAKSRSITLSNTLNCVGLRVIVYHFLVLYRLALFTDRQ